MPLNPDERIESALGLLREPLGIFVDAAMKRTRANVRENYRGTYWEDASQGRQRSGASPPIGVSSLWQQWLREGQIPMNMRVGGKCRAATLTNILMTGHVVYDWWQVVFYHEDTFRERMGPGGQTMFQELVEYRNHKYHGEDIDGRQAARGLETVIRILHAIGEDRLARQVEDLRQPLIEQQARVGPSLGPGHTLQDAPPPAGTWCVGAHWMDPDPDLPNAWWLVAIRDGQMELIRRDLTTAQITDYLSAKATADQPTLVGLAYCFSTPAWFVRGLVPPQASSFWELCESVRDEERQTPGDLARALGPPFRESGTDLEVPLRNDQPEFRDTEVAQGAIPETTPSSVFRIGGSGSVGGLAVLGAPVLKFLSEAGMRIWPIDDAGQHTAVEIFPRGLWAAVDPLADPISTPDARAQFLEHPDIRRLHGIGGGDREVLRRERRAFDAFLTAWALSRYGGSLHGRTINETARLEGEIWIPK